MENKYFILEKQFYGQWILSDMTLNWQKSWYHKALKFFLASLLLISLLILSMVKNPGRIWVKSPKKDLCSFFTIVLFHIIMFKIRVLWCPDIECDWMKKKNSTNKHRSFFALLVQKWPGFLTFSRLRSNVFFSTLSFGFEILKNFTSRGLLMSS